MAILRLSVIWGLYYSHCCKVYIQKKKTRRLSNRRHKYVFFHFYKEFKNWLKWSKISKCVEFQYSNTRNQKKFQKSIFQKFNLENDVIIDAHKVTHSMKTSNAQTIGVYWHFRRYRFFSAIWGLPCKIKQIILSILCWSSKIQRWK